MKKAIQFSLFFLISTLSFAQSEYTIWRKEAIQYIEKNDAKNAIVSLSKIITSFRKSPNAVLEEYLLRAKLYTATSQYENAVTDLNVYLLYDSSCAEAYLSKLILIDNQQQKIALLNSALQRLPNETELLIQKCIVKIGIVSSYWEMQQNNGTAFNKRQAAIDIPIAKQGCSELQQLANQSTGIKELYKKICKIPEINEF